MIEFHDVNFSYGEKETIKNVSFQIPDGETRVIMGHSGSGKSTILRLILGLVRPSKGKILVDGYDICRMKEEELREVRKRVGMVFQDGALFDSLTVGENVGYYPLEYNKSISTEELEEKVSKMLGFVGLSPDIIDDLPDSLSGGMQRRVAIARAFLSTNPSIMLYDEPTTGLDPSMTRTIIDLINKLVNEESVTSIVVTHQISDAFELSDKFILIDNGEKAFDGDITRLRESDDPRVTEFLKPFRESVANVKKIEFI